MKKIKKRTLYKANNIQGDIMYFVLPNNFDRAFQKAQNKFNDIFMGLNARVSNLKNAGIVYFEQLRGEAFWVVIGHKKYNFSNYQVIADNMIDAGKLAIELSKQEYSEEEHRGVFVSQVEIIGEFN